ncbi:MAG: polysaccharide deacetylase family protein [Candidatus Eisenbacteria bacterium]|nr:polysaccharide deacetylase family protein [Candidatus Eisenbacteria bacterium]
MSGRALRWLLSLLPRPRDGAGPRLTIIRHHRVYGDGERPLYRLGVGESLLASQLGLLRRLGLVPLTVADGLAWLASGGSGHRVALSFDDGYADNVRRALPVLAAAGARASFYLTAGLVEERRAPWWDVLEHLLTCTRLERLEWRGRALPLAGHGARSAAVRALVGELRVAPPEQASRLAELASRLGVAEPAPCGLATWEECRALAAAGMEVGAHTLTHPFLTTLAPAEQRAEIGGSIALIHARLGARPAGLAYPGGDHDAESVAAARDCGLAYAVTTRAGDALPAAPRFELPRRGLTEGACLGPGGRFSSRLATAELCGAFDRLRGNAAGRAAEESAA